MLDQICCSIINTYSKTLSHWATQFPQPLFPHSLNSFTVEKHTQSSVVCKLGEPQRWGLTIQALPFRWAGTFSLIHHRKRLNSLVASTAVVVVIFSQMCVEQVERSLLLFIYLFLFSGLKGSMHPDYIKIYLFPVTSCGIQPCT